MPTRAIDLKSAAAEELDISTPFNELMNGIGLSSKDTGGKITFIGTHPIFESRFRIGACISITRVAAEAKISPDDLVITIYEAPAVNFSLGQGEAQRANAVAPS
jgi:hypothetical protein